MKSLYPIRTRSKPNTSLYTDNAFTTTSIEDVGGLALDIDVWTYGHREQWTYTVLHILHPNR
jgi:hypothetical protein